jgi:O-antigen ligase
MSLESRRTLGHDAMPASKDGKGVVRPPRSLLGLLIRRFFAGAAARVAPVGRLFLYVGLLLVALTALRLPGGMGAIADAFLLASMVCALLMLVQGRPLRFGLLKTHLIGLGLVIAGVVIATLMGTSDDWESLLQLGKFIFATTATVVACMVLLERRSQLETALACWVVSAAVVSLAAMLQAATGDQVFVGKWGRAKGLTTNVNHLGAVAGMALGGALCLAALSDRLKRGFWLLTALLCIFGVIASASRAGAIIGLASVGFWGAMFYRLNRELTILVVGCCLAGAALASFMFVQIWDGKDVSTRLASAADPYADGAVASRLYQFEDALRESFQNPLIGTGLARSELQVGNHVIHNTFLMMFRSGGLLALMGVVIILGDLIRKGLVTYDQAESLKSKGLAVGLLTGVIGLILDALVEPVLYQRMYWVPSALLLALLACRAESRHPFRKHLRKVNERRRRMSNTSLVPPL